jgi:drug/metabolite transporter (DMT)-like permease
LFGSLVAFTSYVWLLKVSTPAKVSTYAFVNPIVAVLLGVTIGKEPFGGKMLLATVIILAGVVLITLKPRAAPAVPATVEADATAVANALPTAQSRLREKLEPVA